MVTRLRMLVAAAGLAALAVGGVGPVAAGEKVTFSGTGAGAAITNRAANQLHFPMLRIDNRIGNAPDENVDALLAVPTVAQPVRQPDAKQLEKDDLRRNWIFQAAVGTNGFSSDNLTRQDNSLTNNENARPRTLVERFLAGNEDNADTNNTGSRGLTNKIPGNMTDLEDKLDLDRRNKTGSPGQTAVWGNGSGGATNRSALVFSGSGTNGPVQPDASSLAAGGTGPRDSGLGNSFGQDDRRSADRRSAELRQMVFGPSAPVAGPSGLDLNRQITGGPGYSVSPLNLNNGGSFGAKNGTGFLNAAPRNNLLTDPNNGNFASGGASSMTNRMEPPVMPQKPIVFELPRRAF